MTGLPPGLGLVTDLTSANWVREALRDWPRGRPFMVSDLVPPVFEAYARVLHRTRRPADGLQPTGTWAERATALGRDLGPETTWWRLMGTAPYEGATEQGPDEGRLSESEVATLASFLGAHTADPSACWFALWSGFGFLGADGVLYRRRGGVLAELGVWVRGAVRDRQQRRASRRLATFDLLGQSGRSYLLFRGSVIDAQWFRFGESGWFQSPTLWWPDDRGWFVHTEIDATSTYVGGSRTLIDRLVAEQLLESFEVEADTPAAL
jgi:hypothetical protein